MTEVQDIKWVHGGHYSPIERPNLMTANAGINQMSPVAEPPRRERTSNYTRQRAGNTAAGHAVPQRAKHPSTIQNLRRKAFVRIIEQPASKALRFRYECEGRLAGSLPGVSSTIENKTFPTIEVVGYKGRALVVVSCVTKDPPYKPHPHNLVGKDGCKKGVCTMELNVETMRAVFCNLGIQCVKRKDIDQSLQLREEIRVDPFLTGFNHKCHPGSIDLNSLRLCFQVFLENEHGRFTIPLAPVVSDPIYDKKAMADLLICSLCSCASTVAGGKEIILLCEKVVREDISIRFYEEKNGQIVWEAYGDFRHIDVHKQTAIKFKTPSYHNLEVDRPVTVSIQLKRPSDGVTSEPVPFEYLPLESDPIILKRKRLENGGDPNAYLLKHYPTQERQRYESIGEQQAQNNRMQQYHNNYAHMPSHSPVVTEPEYYGSPPVNYSPNCHTQTQDFTIGNYNNQQQQHWRNEYKQQMAGTDPMVLNNFNVHNLMGAAAPPNSMQWNIPPPNVNYMPQESNNTTKANPNNTQIQQATNYRPQGNKEQNGACSFDVDTDLLMDLNSAELERLTL